MVMTGLSLSRIFKGIYLLGYVFQTMKFDFNSQELSRICNRIVLTLPSGVGKMFSFF